MNTILIVEDEKLIRQGLKAILERAPVHIEKVIECRNGLEAYEIIKSQKIDVMFTDIRMPKMDGISLIKKVQHLKQLPKIVVISGYDDFNYAVQLLSNGVKDYLLKPVNRDKIYNILLELEKEIDDDVLNQKDKKLILYQKVKYILMNISMPGEEIALNTKTFQEYFDNEPYIVLCTNYEGQDIFSQEKMLYYNNISGHKVFIIKESEKDRFIDYALQSCSIGFSETYSSISDIYQAYQQALCDRKNFYLVECEKIRQHKLFAAENSYSEENVDKFVRMIGTKNFDEVLSFLENIVFQTKCGKFELDDLPPIVNMLINKIQEAYKSILNEECEKLRAMENIFAFNTIDDFSKHAKAVLSDINAKLQNEYIDFTRKSKIQSAVLYIHDNYMKDLNMAVVSNYISMNYSLFSSAFKQYTTYNFVEYLKLIRMKKSKDLLEQTDKKVIEISRMVGYNNEKHFMKTFRKTYGVTPSEYRKNIQIANSNSDIIAKTP